MSGADAGRPAVALSIFAYLKVPPDRQAEVSARARDYAALVRQEPGNLSFEVATNGRGEFFFWEAFDDGDAFESHRNSNHVAEWRAFYEPFMIERRIEEVTRLG